MLRFCGFATRVAESGGRCGRLDIPRARVVLRGRFCRNPTMPGIAVPPLSDEPEFCVVARWNVSLPPRARWQIFAALSAVSLTLAFAFAAAGAWMVLPYSLLELSVLAGAFYFVGRRAADWERLTVAGDRVIVERIENGRRTRREWNRPWVRAELSARQFGRPEQLWLCSGTERFEFGAALPPQERGAVARELKRLTSVRAVP
jgi:uncharacterized membrane protein